MMQELILEFDVSQDMVNAFAQLTGDYNSMHMDEEVARKSRYRQTVVHGMLPFSFISLLQSQFPQKAISFKKLAARFKKPVFVGDRVYMELAWHSLGDEIFSIKGKWKRSDNHEVLITASGCFIVRDEPDDISFPSDAREMLLLTKIDENQYVIDDLHEKSEQFSFELCDELSNKYRSSVLTPERLDGYGDVTLCRNLMATILLSTLVGMKLPGRYATFTRFDIDFDLDVKMKHPYILKGIVKKISSATQIMDATVEISGQGGSVASGKIEVILNSPPAAMISYADILKKHLDYGLRGKVVIVTGASRGIGETTVKLFAALGAKVVIGYYRGKTDAARITDEITAGGGEALAIQCDITIKENVKNFVKCVMQRYGRVDVLVNNAVKDVSPKSVEQLEWSHYLQELEVSVKGMHCFCTELIPIFKGLGGGKIVNLSTVFVDNPVDGQSRYITAKSAVVGYTKSLAKELTKYNIQANLVVPNMTDTDLLSSIPQMYKDKLADSRAYKRHVLPIEVAQAIVFLASHWSDAITGQKVVLNLGEPPFA